MGDWPDVLPDDDGIRRGGPADACFYCQQKVGMPHGPECVTVKKRVRVRYSFELEISVPHGWDADAIEFHRNESSWCASNALYELDKAFPENGACPCSVFKCEVIDLGDDVPHRADEDERVGIDSCLAQRT